MQRTSNDCVILNLFELLFTIMFTKDEFDGSEFELIGQFLKEDTDVEDEFK